MIRGKSVPPRWSIVTLEGHRSFEASQLVTPSIPRSGLATLFAGLLPNRSHNEDLLNVLNTLPSVGSDSQPTISIFASDPFIGGKRIAQRLLGKGCKRIVNWPTTAQFGMEFCAALDSVNLGPQQEYKTMMRLASEGLSISLTVCMPEAASELPRLNPDIVFLAPTFELWTNGKLRVDELLGRCAALARKIQGEVPIVLMSAGRGISLDRARNAGAHALLVT